jgi:hypothetical protein
MPKATVDTSVTERFELKTLPEGFVELRRMSYGEFLKRRDMISKVSYEGQGRDTKATMEFAQEVVTRYEFQTCIVDHNLEDDNGKNIDFRSKQAFAVLAPTIGEEIAELIDKLNGFNEEADEDLGN